jgi:hypothetical protein
MMMALTMVLTMWTTSALALKHGIGLDVNTRFNNGHDWSPANPKSDNEQYPYLHIDDISLSRPELLYWNVSNKVTAADSAHLNTRKKILSKDSNNYAPKGNKYWSWQPKGRALYFELDSDRSAVYMKGHWFS